MKFLKAKKDSSSKQKVPLNEELISNSKVGDYDEVERLIIEGADVNAKDKYGWTPILWASYTGCTEIVRLLLEHGSDITHKNNVGVTALDYAKRENNPEIVALLELHACLIEESFSQEGQDKILSQLKEEHDVKEIIKFITKFRKLSSVKKFGTAHTSDGVKKGVPDRLDRIMAHIDVSRRVECLEVEFFGEKKDGDLEDRLAALEEEFIFVWTYENIINNVFLN